MTKLFNEKKPYKHERCISHYCNTRDIKELVFCTLQDKTTSDKVMKSINGDKNFVRRNILSDKVVSKFYQKQRNGFYILEEVLKDTENCKRRELVKVIKK